MKKVVWTFGSIAGAIVVAMMFITIPLYKSGTLNFDNGEVIGYTTMVIAMSMIFFGVKSYRDNYLHGAIRFGTALQVGLLIATIASVMYVGGWEIDLHFFYPDFTQTYAKHVMEKAQQRNASAAEMNTLKDQMAMMEGLYKNVFLRMGITLVEILPIGLIIALLTAAVLRKKETIIV